MPRILKRCTTFILTYFGSGWFHDGPDLYAFLIASVAVRPTDAFAVCPNCSNCLTIALTTGTDEYPEGVNAFQCRTCPYQFILDKPYYERTYMKKKQRDDIMGEDQSSLPINDGESAFTSDDERERC